MRWRHTWLGAVGVGVAVFLAGLPVNAVITRLTPLREVLASEQHIFLARVDKVDPAKPGVVLEVFEHLKGQAPFQRLSVNLTGDSEAQKEKQTGQLLKRLRPGLQLIVFCSQRGKRWTAFGYTHGTWFQMVGQVADEPDRLTWAFTHCEPYLRRTFKGTTEELIAVIRDGLSGKRQPPEPNPKEPPGLGPELPDDKRSDGTLSSGPLFAVIPTFVLVGPLALLASAFGLGGLALFLRRWLVTLSVLCLGSTLWFMQEWFRGSLQGSWWGTTRALWTGFAGLALIGVAWSWIRNRRATRTGGSEVLRRPTAEYLLLGLFSLLGVAAVFRWPLLLPLCGAIWVGTACLMAEFLWSGRWRSRRLPVEVVMLATLGIGFAVRAWSDAPRQAARIAWAFEAVDRGLIASTPVVGADCIYVAAAHSSGFSNHGALYCLDRATGKLRWSFTDDDELKQVFSTPCLADGRLFLGEGFHQDSACKLRCLDAATGEKLWEFATSSHVESTPCVADGLVYFGAGDDGLYCLEAATGRLRWRFAGSHIDTGPVVRNGRVYAGSGYGRLEAFCLDAGTGQPLWRVPLPLPMFATPAVADDRVYCSIGNGDFLRSAAQPAGGIVCLDARSGDLLWRHATADAVHARPVLDGSSLYAASRDGTVYCLDPGTGQLRWRYDVGSPMVATPAVCADRLYVLGSGGQAVCLDAATGRLHWGFDVGTSFQARAELLSSPVVVEDSPRRFVYFGAGLDSLVSKAAVLFCLQDD